MQPLNPIRPQGNKYHSFFVFLFLLFSLGILSFPSPTLAATCGTRSQPSVSPSCVCPVQTKIGVIRVTRRHSLQRCIQRAVQKAKQLCPNHPQARLTWKKVPSSAKKCAISFTCKAPQTKHKGFVWSKKQFFRRGTFKYRFKHRIRHNHKQCKTAARIAKKKRCRRSQTIRPVKFQWKKIRKHMRYFMGYKKGYCRILWKCTYKKKQLAYWCGN